MANNRFVLVTPFNIAYQTEQKTCFDILTPKFTMENYCFCGIGNFKTCIDRKQSKKKKDLESVTFNIWVAWIQLRYLRSWPIDLVYFHINMNLLKFPLFKYTTSVYWLSTVGNI